MMMSATLAASTVSPADDAEANVCSDEKREDPVKPRVYQKRWLILALFCSLSMSSAFQWIQYSIITSAVVNYYGVSTIAVDWTSMIYMLGYIPFVFPATWLLDKYGLRLSALLGAFGTCLGAWIKCASASPDRFAVTFLGQTIVGCSQVFILGIPPRLAAVWFGPNEVSTATSLGVFGNQVGIAIGFYVPTAIVQNATNPEQTGHDLQVLFFATAALASFVFLLIFFIFNDSPPVPPSQAQLAAIAASIESNYLHSLWNLMKNTNYLLLVATYGLNVGVFYGVSTLLSQTLEKFFPDKEQFVGIIGFAIVIAGMFGSIAGGFVLDKTHEFKLTTVIVYICSVAGMLAYSLTIYLYNIWIVFATACLLGFFMTGYLPVGFEFGAELTYPASEGTQSGLLNASAQVFGIALVLGMGVLLRTSGALVCNITMTVVLIIGTVLTVFIKSDLRRQKANMAGEPNTRTEESGLVGDGSSAEFGRFISSQNEQDDSSSPRNSYNMGLTETGSNEKRNGPAASLKF